MAKEMTDKQQPPEIPERLFAKACHPERPNHNCSWSFSKEPVEGSVPYARVHPVDDARVGEIRRLTLPELNHLMGLLDAEKESGEYAGPREQYYARTERLIKWCQEQING
jgi:hypothetical protein